MKLNGYIKLHRALNNWEWKSDPKMVALFVHLLLNANYEESSWKGIKLKPGQLIVGRKETSRECGITEDEYRSRMNKLKLTNEITIKTTNKFSIVTLVNWELYQSGENENPQQKTQQIPNKSPTNPQQIPTGKEIKKERNKEIYNGDFDEFWKSYYPIETKDKISSKGNKETARIAYNKARQEHDKNVIYSGAGRYLLHCRNNGTLSCHVSTFLNQKRFLDDYNEKTIKAVK